MDKSSIAGNRSIAIAFGLILAAAATPLAKASDAVSYRLDDTYLNIQGTFNSAVDQVSIQALDSEYYGQKDVSLAQAKEHVGSIFEIRIGDHFSEVFGERTPIDFEAFGTPPEFEYIYDYASFRGACVRPSNGQIALMVDLKEGGTINAGNPPDTLFIFADQDDQVAYEIIDRDEWTDAHCLDGARETAELTKRARQEEEALVALLATQPIDEWNLPESLTIRTLDQDPREKIRDHLHRFAAYYFPSYCADKMDDYVEECAKARSSFDVVFETGNFDIYRARFIRYCESSGFDILHNKIEGTWSTMFTSPSGCSKYYLCEPEYLDINGNILSANLPLDCQHWGQWERAKFDLKRFEVSAQ